MTHDIKYDELPWYDEKVFDEGFAARLNDCSLAGNPHDERGWVGRSWSAGWAEADREILGTKG